MSGLKYEIKGRIRGSDMLLICECSAEDGRPLAFYQAAQRSFGDVPVYVLYPCSRGITDAGLVRNVKYKKKTINQRDVFKASMDIWSL